MNHPPKPNLTLRVGVTGHRPGTQLLDESLSRVQSQVEAVFSAIVETLAQAHDQFQATYSTAPPQVRIISSLAEGADRIVAQTALAHRFELEVILPFDRSIYETDFASERSRGEFNAFLDRASAVFEIDDEDAIVERDRAYVAAGEALIAQCDLLLAIWDGAPARGQGGTAEILGAAGRLGVPYVWINAARMCEPIVGGHRSDARRSFGRAGGPTWAAELEREIWGLVSPPNSTNSQERDGEEMPRPSVEAGILNFFAETERLLDWAIPYDLLRWVFAGRPLRLRSRSISLASQPEWKDFLDALPALGGLKGRLASVLFQRYLWADHLATYYGNVYRSAYVTVFGLAGLSVVVGLISLFAETHLMMKASLILVEVLLISVMLWIINYGRKRRWHDRWLDYRQIAELLRHARFISLTGRLTYGYSEDLLLTDTPYKWSAWYVRSTLRELGLPNVLAEKSHVASIINAAIVHEIDPQIAFHRANARELSRLNHRLDRIGTSLFLLTFLVGISFLCLTLLTLVAHFGNTFEMILEGVLKPAEIMLMAGLPALGAAIAGIRAQGDFKTSADRSELAAARLTALKAQLTEEAGDPKFYRVSSLLHVVGRTMASELDSWQFIYRHRPLALPS